jgi:hypothetical protein
MDLEASSNAQNVMFLRHQAPATHLAGLKAAESGYSALFLTVESLMGCHSAPAR